MQGHSHHFIDHYSQVYVFGLSRYTYHFADVEGFSNEVLTGSGQVGREVNFEFHNEVAFFLRVVYDRHSFTHNDFLVRWTN